MIDLNTWCLVHFKTWRFLGHQGQFLSMPHRAVPALASWVPQNVWALCSWLLESFSVLSVSYLCKIFKNVPFVSVTVHKTVKQNMNKRYQFIYGLSISWVEFFCKLVIKRHLRINTFREEFTTYPSSFEQFPSEVLCWVLEGQLLTSDVIDRRLLLRVQEQVIVQDNFLWLFLRAEVNFYPHKESSVPWFRYLVGWLLNHWGTKSNMK